MLEQCEATIQEIECGFPLELHIVIHADGCAVACEPPACPVNNVFCVNAACSVCLPAEVELPLEECHAFLQSCDPADLHPMSTTSEDATAGPGADTGSSTTGSTTNSGDATEASSSVDETSS